MRMSATCRKRQRNYDLTVIAVDAPFRNVRRQHRCRRNKSLCPNPPKTTPNDNSSAAISCRIPKRSSAHHLNEQRISICIAVHGHSLNPHLLGCFHDPHCNFTSVCNEDLVDSIYFCSVKYFWYVFSESTYNIKIFFIILKKQIFCLWNCEPCPCSEEFIDNFGTNNLQLNATCVLSHQWGHNDTKSHFKAKHVPKLKSSICAGTHLCCHDLPCTILVLVFWEYKN